MTTSVGTRGFALWIELMDARSHLVEARARQQQKDSTSNRAAVATCITTMDRVLDRYLEANHRS